MCMSLSLSQIHIHSSLHIHKPGWEGLHTLQNLEINTQGMQPIIDKLLFIYTFLPHDCQCAAIHVAVYTPVTV